jgi:hypothetical protein
MNLLLQSKGAELKKIARTELNEEKKAEPPKPEKGAKGKPESDKKLVQAMSFQVEFVTTQGAFRNVLNGIVGNSQQFFVVRNISIKNDKPEPPTKEEKNPPPPPPPPGADGKPAPPTPAPGPDAQPQEPRQAVEMVFGSEKVEVVLDIDMLDFAEPEAPAPEKGSGNKPK